MNCSSGGWLQDVLLCSCSWDQRVPSAPGLDPTVTDTTEPVGVSLEKRLKARQMCWSFTNDTAYPCSSEQISLLLTGPFFAAKHKNMFFFFVKEYCVFPSLLISTTMKNKIKRQPRRTLCISRLHSKETIPVQTYDLLLFWRGS